MKLSAFPALTIVFTAVLCATAARGFALQPSQQATAGFNAYVSAVEARLDRQHQVPDSFLVPGSSDPQRDLRLRRGDFLVEDLSPIPAADPPGALIHHWRATAFVAGATAKRFERLLRNFPAYPEYFAPQVTSARVLSAQGDHINAALRLRQHHVLTVILDADYDVSFSMLDARHGYSVSHSTRIAEIDSSSGRALPPADDHGFLWRLNTYWTWEERDGGLYLQVESVSLTRSIPAGLGWAVRPFVDSVPRDSLEFTLRSVCAVLRRAPQAALAGRIENQFPVGAQR